MDNSDTLNCPFFYFFTLFLIKLYPPSVYLQKIPKIEQNNTTI
jgi:hypothetical protein